MNRKYKVKRFGQLYSSHRSTPSIVLRTVLTLSIVFVLGFVGWNAYIPVCDYFSGALAAASHESKITSSITTPIEKNTEIQKQEIPITPQPPSSLHAIYLSPDIISNSSALNAAFTKIEKTDINAVLFDLKDLNGNVNFQSNLESVTKAGSQSVDAVDLDELCKTLSDKDLVPIGKLNAFSDVIAASKLEGAGVKYMNTNMLWLDDSPENGGKSWLNPYSEVTQKYINDLISEAATKGVKHILLDQYNFPISGGLEFANFGTKAKTISSTEVLSKFISTLEKNATEHDCEISLYVSGIAALDKQNQSFGNQNPLLLSKNITLGLMPAQFGDSYKNGDFSPETPVLLPYQTVKTLLEKLKPQLSGKKIAGMLQGYTTTGTLENNKVYTWDDIEEQIRALSEQNIENYILYSPGGNYPDLKG